MSDVESSHWWYVGRREILRSVLDSLDLRSDANILEIGCGTGGNLAMLTEFGHVFALERDPTARQIAVGKTEGRVDIRSGSCPSDVPFSKGHFDLVCLFDVLEHIDEEVETLAAARKLLRPGGRVLVTVPAYTWLWGVHDEFLHHKRRYTCGRLLDASQRAGLTPYRSSYFNTLLFPLAALIRVKERVFRSSAPAGSEIPVRPLNRLLSVIFGLEKYLLRIIRLPYGVSVLGVLGKTETPST